MKTSFHDEKEQKKTINCKPVSCKLRVLEKTKAWF